MKNFQMMDLTYVAELKQALEDERNKNHDFRQQLTDAEDEIRELKIKLIKKDK